MKKSLFKKRIAETQDGRLTGTGSLDSLILESIENAEDVESFKMSLEYARKELQRALKAINDLNPQLPLTEDKTVMEIMREVDQAGKEVSEEAAMICLEDQAKTIEMRGDIKDWKGGSK